MINRINEITNDCVTDDNVIDESINYKNENKYKKFKNDFEYENIIENNDDKDNDFGINFDFPDFSDIDDIDDFEIKYETIDNKRENDSSNIEATLEKNNNIDENVEFGYNDNNTIELLKKCIYSQADPNLQNGNSIENNGVDDSQNENDKNKYRFTDLPYMNRNCVSLNNLKIDNFVAGLLLDEDFKMVNNYIKEGYDIKRLIGISDIKKYIICELISMMVINNISKEILMNRINDDKILISYIIGDNHITDFFQSENIFDYDNLCELIYKNPALINLLITNKIIKAEDYKGLNIKTYNK